MLFMKNYYYFMHNRKIYRRHYKKFSFYKDIKNRKRYNKKKKAKILSKSINHDVFEDLLNELHSKNVNNDRETNHVNVDEHLFDIFENFSTSILTKIPSWLICSIFYDLYKCQSNGMYRHFYLDLIKSNKKFAYEIFFK
ncbi:conserved Plasmodium protein, unknown function [Plasmodium relictum]|uniref:Uncharacterized protein n=1 Tax=Plasmodium relictum TaxID=85471 RepID=A0A1J1H2G0_PLARL|nr:conserved Plasmodium protein, unknown function [Plasmodium relictum]CRG99044.1 conserved Plasmodium protein, unknown function [Plasmodium relictum]